MNLATAENVYWAALAEAGRAHRLTGAQLDAAEPGAAAARRVGESMAATLDQFQPGLPGIVAARAPALGPLADVGPYYGDAVPWSFSWLGAGFWGDWLGTIGDLLSLDWGYGASDWYAGYAPGEGGIGAGFLGWAGPWGGWTYYDAWSGYGVPGWTWAGWNAHYSGVATQPAGGDHAIDVDREVQEHSALINVASSAVRILAQSLLEEIASQASLVVHAATGAILVGSMAVLNAREAARLKEFITDRSGPNWSGDQVYRLLQIHAPEFLPFIEKRIALSGGAPYVGTWYHGVLQKAHAELRYGDYGPLIKSLHDGLADSNLRVLIEIPDDWNDFQVAAFVLEAITGTGHPDIAQLFQQWATSAEGADALARWNREHHLPGLQAAGEAIRDVFKTFASVIPGGALSVAIYEYQAGNYNAAALEVLFMGPVLKLLGKGAQGVAAVTIKVGGKVVANIPIRLIKQIQGSIEAQRELTQIIRRADSVEEVLEEFGQFLKRHRFDGHGGTALATGPVPKEVVERLKLFDGVSPAQLKALTSGQVGDLGEAIVRKLLADAGYTDLLVLKNASGHGVDVIAKLGGGRYAVFEVKASHGLPTPKGKPNVPKGLTREQRDLGVLDWTVKRLRAAANRAGAYKNINEAKRLEAQRLLDEFGRTPDNVSGNLIQVNLSTGVIDVKPWQ